MKFICGVSVSDTQTGLRAIPLSAIPALIDVSGERFEYETNMLLETSKLKLGIKEVIIERDYADIIFRVCEEMLHSGFDSATFSTVDLVRQNFAVVFIFQFGENRSTFISTTIVNNNEVFIADGTKTFDNAEYFFAWIEGRDHDRQIKHLYLRLIKKLTQ